MQVRQATVDWSALYFILIISIGPFFIVSLVLAVLVNSFYEVLSEEKSPTASVPGLLKDVGLNIGLGVGVGVDLELSRVAKLRSLRPSAARNWVESMGQGKHDQIPSWNDEPEVQYKGY